MSISAKLLRSTPGAKAGICRSPPAPPSAAGLAGVAPVVAAVAVAVAAGGLLPSERGAATELTRAPWTRPGRASGRARNALLACSSYGALERVVVGDLNVRLARHPAGEVVEVIRVAIQVGLGQQAEEISAAGRELGEGE